MSGPLSVPNGDRALYERLREDVCVKHKDCVGEKGTKRNPCVFMKRREFLLSVNRLQTGKTR